MSRAEAALAADAADAIADRVKVLRDALDELERDLTGRRASSGTSPVAARKGDRKAAAAALTAG